MNRKTVILVFICIVVAYGVSCHQRLADYRFWMENPRDYVVDNVTAMSSLDAYYWLKMAREIDNGTLGKGTVSPIKGYPDLVHFALKDKPSLLAELISLAKNFTGGDYYKAGLLLIPFLAGLFIFPLFFYFNRLGFGASAILGGLVGSLGHAYYDRTMMGRVDTDLLNTFFPLTVACFILAMRREKTWRANIFLATGAGITMYLYSWWYQVPAFILVFLFFMALHLLFGRVSWKQIVTVLLIYLLFSGPHYVLQSLESLRTFLVAYFTPAPPAGNIAWPNILHTVAEVQTRSLATKFNMLHGFRPFVFAGFAGLLYLCLRRFRQMIPIGPLLIIGCWAMVGPARFVMYLAPFIGIGVGVLIELLIRYGGGKLRLKPLLVPLTSSALMFILFFSTAGYTSYGLHTAPIMSMETTRAMLEIKRIVPKHSPMFTPFWAFGYPLMEIGDFATYHDGGLQGGMRSALTARAVVSSRQEDMVSLLSYLEDNGFNGLNRQIKKENLSGDQMLDLVFSYPEKFKGKNVYVLYLGENIWKMDSLTYLGTWDFNTKKSNPMGYVELHCTSLVNDLMRCSDGTIDLRRGFMNDGTIDIPLRAALFVNNGYIVDQRKYEKNYGFNQGYYLQVLMKDRKINMILVADDRLFPTNFNQQYLLGNFDRRYFEEVYNDFPVARLLRVKNAAE